VTAALTRLVVAAPVLLKDRMLILGTGDSVVALASDVDHDHGGIVVAGKNPREVLRQLRRAYPAMVLLEQPNIHEQLCATASRPFPTGAELGDGDGRELALFAVNEPTLAEALDAQLAAGASVAITPTGFIESGSHDAMTGLVAQANALDRQDTIVHLPLAPTWLAVEADRRKLIAAITRLKHPVVISIADRGDPAAGTGVVEGLIAVFAAAGTKAGVWYSDLGVLEALALGGLCGAVGVTSSARHILVPGTIARSPSKGQDRTPNAIIPGLSRFKRARAMQSDWFANGGDPGCSCAICQSGEISRFDSSAEDILAAHRHNLLWFQTHHLALLASTNRQVWWADHLAEAAAGHAALASATGVRAISPDAALAKRIKLNPPPTETSH
jgi:hypothetical protein